MSNVLKMSFGLTKRALTVAVVVTTILWSVAASFAVAPRAAHAAATVNSGDLVKGSMSAVYYVGSDMKRYVFTSDKAYKTWYADFSTVKTISDTDLASIMIGGNVTYRPGVKMVKIQSDPKVYAVAHGGVLRWVSTEAAAVAIFGADWNKKIDDIADAFFVNYTVGSQISSASDFVVANEQTMAPTINADKGLSGSGALNVSLASDNTAGATVTKNAQGVNLLKVNLSGTGTVTGLTFTRNGAGIAADWSNIYLYDGDSRLTTGRSVSSTTNQVSFSSLNVAVSGSKVLTLVGDLATAGATVGNAHYFSLAAATDVVSGTTVGGTFPVAGNTFTVSGSNGGSVTIAAGSTPSNPKLGESGVELANFKLTAGGTEDISVRRLVITNSGAAQLTNLANLKIVTAGTVVAQNPTISGSTATFVFAVPYTLAKGITRVFSVTGDISAGNRAGVDTIKLYVDQTYDLYATGNVYGAGVNVTDNFASGNATSLSIQGGQITFAFNGPTTGDVSVGANDAVLEKFAITSVNHVEVRNLKLRIVANAAIAADIASITDCKVKNTDTGSTVTNQVDLTGWTNVGAANTTFTKTFTDRFEIGAGQTMNLALTCDILSTATAALAGKTLTATLDARVDGDIRNLDSNLDVAASDIVPASALSGNGQTVRVSGLTVGVASSPSSATVTKGSTVNALGLNFTAGSASDVKISQLKVRGMITVDASPTVYDLSSTSTGVVAAHTVQDVIQSATIWDGSTQLGAAVSPDTNGDMNFSNLAWSVPAGTTKTVTVKVTLSNNLPYGSSANKFLVDMIGAGLADNSTANVTAQDKDSNTVTATSTKWTAANVHMNEGTAAAQGTATTLTTTDAIAITALGSGTLQVQIDGDTPVSAIVSANTSDNALTRIKFNSVNEAFNVTRLTVSNSGSASSSRSITQVRVFDKNGTLFCSGALDSNNRLRCANDSGLFTVDGGATITIKANIDQEGSGTTGANSGDAPKLALYADTANADDIKVVGVSSGTALAGADIGGGSLTLSDTPAGTVYEIEGNAVTVRKTQPTLATVASSTSLTNGQNTIYKFSVTAAANSDVAIRKFTLNSSAAIAAAGAANTVQVYENGTLLDSSLYTVTTAAGLDLKATAHEIGEGDNSVVVSFVTERVTAAGTTKTYDIKSSVTGAVAGNSISTYMVSDVVGNLVTTGTVADILTNASANFVWSDNSADVHAATAAGTVGSGNSADWTNGYLVKTLPSTPQSLSL